MKDRIYLSSPHMSAEGYEKEFIEDAFRKNWIAPLGENVTKFEEEMSAFTGAPKAVALSSGSAAIHLGLKYLGVVEGDIVFCSSFTFSGSCNAVKYLNATPVFIDSDYATCNMSAEALEKAYEKYDPKAIIIVDLYGNPADYDKLKAVIAKHGTPILEDAAEALGSTYKGTQCGNFGDIGVLSFNGNKIITTSGGGMALVKDTAAKEKLTFWATQSREPYPWYQHKEVGYNYRLSNICAGIGRGQLKVLKDRIKRKREIAALYEREFRSVPDITLNPETDGAKSNRWLSAILLSQTCKTTFMDIVNALAGENIESRPAWKPMHLQPVFADAPFFTVAGGKSRHMENRPFSVAEDLFDRMVCLPSDTKMRDADVTYVADIVKRTVTGQ